LDVWHWRHLEEVGLGGAGTDIARHGPREPHISGLDTVEEVVYRGNRTASDGSGQCPEVARYLFGVAVPQPNTDRRLGVQVEIIAGGIVLLR
jgi:hypothetical protein